MSQPKTQLDTFRAWAGKESDIRQIAFAHSPRTQGSYKARQLLLVIPSHRYMLLDPRGQSYPHSRGRQRSDWDRNQRAIQLCSGNGGHYHPSSGLAVYYKRYAQRHSRLRCLMDSSSQFRRAFRATLVLSGRKGLVQILVVN